MREMALRSLLPNRLLRLHMADDGKLGRNVHSYRIKSLYTTYTVILSQMLGITAWVNKIYCLIV